MNRPLAYAIAFFSGCVFLGLELVSSRVLAPFFGNSIHVWGALISVFLFALTVGYFLGGRLADRRPRFGVLGMVMGLAAVGIAAVPSLSAPVSVAVLAAGLDFRLAVLLACTLLFIAPSVLMGMVSPYVIKLSAERLEQVGRSAGDIYAISTLGSISGALGVAFFLVPAIGSTAILYLLAGTLAATATLCLAPRLRR